MKKYIILIIGILGLLASFVWMVLSRQSTGGFLILSGISGTVIFRGIYQIRKK